MAHVQSPPQLGSVLVIGGCGFLGHHIVQQLLDSKRAQVAAFDLTVERNRLLGVSYTGDICSTTDVQAVLQKERPQVIIHTASPLALHHQGIELYDKVNVHGTRTLLEAAQESGTVRAFVYTSSASVVHDSVTDLVNADESYPVLRMPEQREPYSHTKGVADEMVLAANGTKGMLTCCLRPAGMFGENDHGTLEPMIRSAQEGKGRFQIGNGTNLFDFTYVGNAATAHVLAASALVHADHAEVEKGMRVDGEAFFVTNGEPWRFWEFTRAVGATAGFPTDPATIRTIPAWLGLLTGTISEWLVWAMSRGQRRPRMTRQGIAYSCMTRTYNIDKARQRLGYRPALSIQEGLQRACQHWVAQHSAELEEKKKV